MVFFSLLSYTTIFDAIQRYRKLRFSVYRRGQTALFREPGLTECAFP